MVDIPFKYVCPLQCLKKNKWFTMSFGHFAKSQRVLAFCVQVWVVGIWPKNFVFLLMPRIVVDSGTGLQLRELKLRRGAKGRVEDFGAICFWPIKTDSIHLYTYLFCCGTGAFTVGVILVLWILLW